MIKGRVLGPRILVKQIEEGNTTKGGIIIPDQCRDRPMRGRVVAKGAGGNVNGSWESTDDVAIGEEILFGKMAGHECMIDGEKFVIMKITDVMFVPSAA